VTRNNGNWIVSPQWAYTYSVPGPSRIQSNTALYNQGGGRVRCSVQFFPDGGIVYGRMDNVSGTYLSGSGGLVGARVSSHQTKKDIIPLDGSTASRRTISDGFETLFDQIQFVRYSYDLDHPINQSYGEHTPLLGVISENLKDINPDWVVEIPNVTIDTDTDTEVPRWEGVTEPIYALNQENLMMSTMLALRLARVKISQLEARIEALEA
jgi:hypothetical protein